MSARAWTTCAVVGVAALLGGTGQIGLFAGVAPPVDRIMDALFGAADSRRKARARKLSDCAARALARHAASADPGAAESARLATTEVLKDHGLTDAAFTDLGLDAEKAAGRVLDRARFSADEAIEIRPLCRELLVCFYTSLPENPDLLADLLPHIHHESLKRLGRIEDKQDETNARLARMETMLRQISGEKGVPLPALEAILRAFGDEAERLEPAEIERRLRAKAEEFQALSKRLRRLSNDDPDVHRLKQEAASLLEHGQLDAVKAKLLKAKARRRGNRVELEALVRQAKFQEAEDEAELAAVARLQFAYREAAAHCAAAHDLLPEDAGEERWRYRKEQADTLFRQGDEFGDNTALEDAIALRRRLIQDTPREEQAERWAALQNDLGIVLARLGERESGTDRLEEAVAAYRLALEEWTRARVPLQWAGTQNNLGLALMRLGEREAGTDRLEEAVAAFRLALEEQTRARVPLDWAGTQNNLGLVLMRLGEHEFGTARLDEAVDAYRLALQELTRDRVPLDWARTQNNLGLALSKLGKREGTADLLREAVAAFRLALEEWTRERVPLDWARTQNNLGGALAPLSEHEGGTELVEEAVAAFRLALEEHTRERVPLDWAMAQNNLGIGLLVLAERTGDVGAAEKAVQALTDAREVTAEEAGQTHRAAWFDQAITVARDLARRLGS